MTSDSPSLAPIVFFAFNRPEHTKKSLEALRRNPLAKHSILYIHCDGPRADESAESRAWIGEVRRIAKAQQWCGEVRYIFRRYNRGLLRGLTGTIGELFDQYESLIILEDDVVPEPGFLDYMNQALALYRADEQVMHVSAYSPSRRGQREAAQSTFFYNHTSCWGWGTWRRAWRKFNPSPLELRHRIRNSGNKRYVNLDNTFDFYWGLKYIADGRFGDWNYLWHTSVVTNGGLCLHPVRSLTTNIGFDALGTNCAIDTRQHVQPVVETLAIERIPLIEDPSLRREILAQPFHKNVMFAGKNILRDFLGALGIRRFREPKTYQAA